MKNFIEVNFKIIVVVLQIVTLLFLFSIKMTTCTIENDIRTTKKNTKAIKEETITSDQLDAKLKTQQDSILVKEKRMDKQK